MLIRGRACASVSLEALQMDGTNPGVGATIARDRRWERRRREKGRM
jgi:hypothetical protein